MVIGQNISNSGGLSTIPNVGGVVLLVQRGLRILPLPILINVRKGLLPAGTLSNPDCVTNQTWQSPMFIGHWVRLQPAAEKSMNEAEEGIHDAFFCTSNKYKVALPPTFAKRADKNLISYRSLTCCLFVGKASKRRIDLILVKGNLAIRYEAKMLANVFQG